MKKTNHIVAILIGLALATVSYSVPTKKVKAAPKAKFTSSRMKVEEPARLSAATSTKVSSKNSKKQHAPAVGLTKDQKVAFRVRKEKMEQMITLITKKRLALQAAKPEERVALARELHRLIIDQNVEGTATTIQARVFTPVQTVSPILIPKTTTLPSVNTEIGP